MHSSHSISSNLRHILAQTEVLIKNHGCAKTTLKMIMDKAGVSKGAIYHYVSSKDELFGLMLESHIEKVDETFWSTLGDNCDSLEKPLQAITDGMTFFLNQDDVTNLIFTYLLSKKDIPAVGKVLEKFYSFSESQAISWIKAGQQGGVINPKIDASSKASSFLAYSYGLRVMHIITPERVAELKAEYYSFMFQTLSIK